MRKLLLLGFMLGALGVAAVDDRPNILWLTSEDNSAQWLGCYGNEHATTPHLDQLARDGFRYTQCYANAPVCAPSRSTWITGVLALSMGTHPMRSDYAIPHDQIRFYPDYLNERGYYTANWKKTDYNIGGRPANACWDNMKKLDWQALQTQQPFFQVINFTSSHESRAFGDVENTRHNPANTSLAAYHPDVPDMRGNYALYHDAIEKMDGEVGAALQRLEELGLAENTIVIYNSDHGGVLPRSKRFLFQNSLHCPLIIRVPEKYKHLWPADKPGASIDRLVSFVDMPKTWLSITGSEVPAVMQGTTFLGKDTESEQPFHFAFRGRMDERIENARAVTDGRFLYIRNYMPYVPWMQKLTFLWNMKASQAWDKAVRDGSANEVQARFFAPKKWTEELYDMEQDPDNINNLIDSPEHREVLAKMRVRLRGKQEAIYDAGLMPETDVVRWAKKSELTIYEWVRDPNRYNVPALLDAADLALQEDSNNLPQLHKLLQDPHPGMRYWGIVGCFLLNDIEGGHAVLDDESHEIRAMAAWLLIREGDKEKGLACLQALIEQRSYALLTILNVVDWMGADGRALIPSIQALNFVEQWKNQYKYEIRMRDIVLEQYGESSGMIQDD